MKIQDFTRIFEDFEKLNVELGKSKKVIDEDGYPKEYMRIVIK